VQYVITTLYYVTTRAVRYNDVILCNTGRTKLKTRWRGCGASCLMTKGWGKLSDDIWVGRVV